MNMLGKFKLLGVLLAVILFAVSGKVDAAPNWNTNTIQVTGMGVANPQLARSPAHASMMARRAAIADAYRQMAEIVQGVQVDAETTVEQMMLTSDIVKTRISAVIKGAQIVSEGELAGGGYSVTMELPLFGGQGGLAEAVIERPKMVEPFPMPAPDYRPPTDYTPPSVPNYEPAPRGGNYTGLVVDCRGVGTINFVMSPVVKRVDGSKIYGHKNLDYDRIIREGMATYAQDMSQAGRAGSNPLIVRAVRLDDLNANPVLSMEDAEMVLYENSVSHFLENIAVVFLY
ncbi:MAG: LPP20 family lipoprotein [Selenomonadaceae bacterium]|nr:LPP20 family lipoprotein [Selenomonadaceae bacterium]MBR6888613.1 LPP20 family lipoprotein [Selenomonadaceae bacterium]